MVSKILTKIKLYGELVMFEHTLFSLPFLIVTFLIATNGKIDFEVIIWAILALVGARTGANAWNRVADAQIDAANPRTASRHIPIGKVKLIEAIALTIGSYIVYYLCAYQINEMCFKLAWIPLVFFTVYPYTKRFTFVCHLVLGVSCAFAILGAWIAATNGLFTIGYENSQIHVSFDIVPAILFGAILLWNAGFDTIYGMQDIDHDRSHNIYSIPARFGLRNAKIIAVSFHLIMMALLFSLVLFTPLSTIYICGLVIVVALLFLEHHLIEPKNKVIMKFTSYKLNQIISLVIMTSVILDIYL